MKKSSIANRRRITCGLRTSKSNGNPARTLFSDLRSLDGRVSLVPHDDQQVHIRIGARPAGCVGAEQHDALRVKLPGDLADKSLDCVAINHYLLFAKFYPLLSRRPTIAGSSARFARVRVLPPSLKAKNATGLFF